MGDCHNALRRPNDPFNKGADAPRLRTRNFVLLKTETFEIEGDASKSEKKKLTFAESKTQQKAFLRLAVELINFESSRDRLKFSSF